MKYCTKCGKELFDEAVICPQCGCATNPTTTTAKSATPENDEISIGLCILAALIPLFGFIYWPVKYKETPNKAKACGITAIVSWAISFVILLASGM